MKYSDVINATWRTASGMKYWPISMESDIDEILHAESHCNHDEQINWYGDTV